MTNNKPNLFILGVAKSGTTTLYSYLNSHPQVFMSAAKEPRFFSRDSLYSNGEAWYLKTHFANSEERIIRGEATPTYLSLYEKTIPRIQKFLGKDSAKFIVIFRNPVDRAYSHYWFNYNTKVYRPEELSFEEALLAEDIRRKNHPEYYDEGIISFEYCKTGYYIDALEPYITAFGKDNFEFMLFEDLFEGRFQMSMKKATNFLSLADFEYQYSKKNSSVLIKNMAIKRAWMNLRKVRKIASPKIFKDVNSRIHSMIKWLTEQPFKYPEINPSIKKELTDRFTPSILELEKIIDRDLSHWIED